MFQMQNFWRKSLFIFLILPFLFLFQKVSGQTETEITALEINKPIERKLSVKSNDNTYQIALSADQYANITIEQNGVDVIARLFSADGDLIADVNSETTAGGTEKIEFVAETGGNYRIEIKSGQPKAGSGKYVIRLKELHTATVDEKLAGEAWRKFYESLRQNDNGNFDLALELTNRSLEIREKIYGEDHALTAASMLLVSRLYMTKNNLAQADVLARRALEALAKNYGEESLYYADVLSLTALIRHRQTNYPEAESLNLKALAIREKTAGENSVAAADSFHNLALLYRATNDYPKAEQNFRRALAIYEKFLGEDRSETANLLNNFGLFYYGTGDFQTAASILLRSLAIKEKVLSENHRQIGIAYNNLGLVEWKNKNYEKAKQHYLRALKIFEIVNGPESDGVANISGNLGVIYKESDKDLTKAEEYYKRALAIDEKNYGEYHQNTANGVSSLAILYLAMGDFRRAEQFGLRALAIHENVSGEYNHYTLLALGSMVRLCIVNDKIDCAVNYLQRLNAIHEKIIPINLKIGSERQKIAYYNQTIRFDNTITLHAQNAPDDEVMTKLAATALLRHKGRVLDAVSENLSALQTRLSPEDRKLLDDLNDVNSRLSKTLLSRQQNISAEEKEKQFKTLEAEREKIENEISHRSAGFYETSQPITLDLVRAEIPNDAALVEFAVYRPFNWKALQNMPDKGEPRYIAYVVRQSGKIQWKELGDKKAIDKIIEEFRVGLRDPKRTDVEKLARAADEKLFQPIRGLVKDAKHLLISPDGDLNLIPFEALVDENGKYLVENYSFTYLTSGRDLLRLRTARESKSKSLIIANPSFGVSADIKTVSKKQSVTAARDLTDTYFAPLAGTVQEARSIQTQFPAALLLTEDKANENALKQVVAPRILHIASHGFFLENTDELNDKSDEKKRGGKPNTETENPLLRSGIALAGANRREGAKDDGILTALEASGLNLWGTKLVVLSACDTGIGDVKNGEGVFGLRRAFVLAGTESLVMSLWAVSDAATRELMTGYYKNLKNGNGRSEALRKVKLEMMKKNGREHPFYWAAFIEFGEWANLDGKR